MPVPRAPPPAPGGATVFIGARPTMSYVFEVVAQLHSGAGPVVVKARGLAIAKAVDVVEVVRNKFLAGEVVVGAIRIETERLTNRSGRDTNVSSIAIPLERFVSGGGVPPPSTGTVAGAGGRGPTSPPSSPPRAVVPG
jgi:DNA-binding protein